MARFRFPSAELWRFGLLFLAPALTLVAIAEEVAEREPLRFDHLLVPGIGPLHFEPLTLFFGVIAVVGGGIGLVAVASIPIGHLITRRRYDAALFTTLALGGAWIINRLLKIWVARPRPEVQMSPLPAEWKLVLAGVIGAAMIAAWPTRWRRVALAAFAAFSALGVVDLIVTTAIPLSVHGDSFPSGHAVGSMTLAAALVVLTWKTRWRWLVCSGGGIFVVVVGVSRIYFGLHYASDIFGGWLLALAWVVLLSLLFRSRLKRDAAAEPSRA